MLKYFQIWFWFSGDIHMCKYLSGAIDPTESDSLESSSTMSNSAVSRNFCNRFFHDSNSLWPNIHVLVAAKVCEYIAHLFLFILSTCWLRGANDIDESDFAVSLTLLSQTPQCHWYRWVKLRCVIDSPVLTLLFFFEIKTCLNQDHGLKLCFMFTVLR